MIRRFAAVALTAAAVASTIPEPTGWTVIATEPFSSARKWSGAQFAEQGTFYFGAPDILFDDDDDDERARAHDEAEQGKRVLLLTRSDVPLSRELPPQRDPVALILLEDTVRPDAPEILRFFADQGVDLKVISGDNVATVAAVAERAGVPMADANMDARDLPEDADDLAAVMDTTRRRLSVSRRDRRRARRADPAARGPAPRAPCRLRAVPRVAGS